MDDILTNLGDDALTRAIKANVYLCWHVVLRSPGVEIITGPKLTCWHTAVPLHLFQIILIKQPGDDGDKHMLQEAIDFFTVRGVTALTCFFDVGVPVAGWIEPLRELGFTLDAGMPGLAIDLDLLREGRPVAGEFHIQAIQDHEAFSEWVRPYILGSEMSSEVGEPLFDLFARAGHQLPFRHYMGYLDGKPVATSSLFLGAGVAGIYNVATLPEARRKGIGAAVTAAPLKDAKSLGYRAGILHASPMGLPVYERLGFRRLCNVEWYLWKKPV